MDALAKANGLFRFKLSGCLPLHVDQSGSHTPSGVFDGLGKNVKLLEETHKEAWMSGDKNKQRAISEVLEYAPVKIKTEDIALKDTINHLSKQAENDIEKIRITPEIRKACIDVETALSDYQTPRQELVLTVRDLGEPGPILIYSNTSLEISLIQK